MYPASGFVNKGSLSFSNVITIEDVKLNFGGRIVKVPTSLVPMPVRSLDSNLAERSDLIGFEYNVDTKILSIRTFAGSDNGKWENTRSYINTPLRFDGSNPVLSLGGNAFDYNADDIGSFYDGVDSYFIVLGTFTELNLGLYHESLNYFGSYKTSDNLFWYNTALSILTKADCFNPSNIGVVTGRPDDRVATNLYPGGQGGFIDQRLSVSEDYNKAKSTRKAQDKNGETRGRELLPLTSISAGVVTVTDFTVEVSDEFSQTDYIGVAATVEIFNDEFIGNHNATIPDGIIDTFELTNKAISVEQGLRSTDNGVTWVLFTPTFDPITNSITLTNEPAANIVIIDYTAHTKHTQPTTNPVVFNGEDGLGGVLVSSYYTPGYGALLSESLLGIVNKNSFGGLHQGVTLNLLSTVLFNNGTMSTQLGTRHSPLIMLNPQNNSNAIKALFGEVAINGLMYPVYWYTELVYSSASWNDDSLVHVVDNDTTMLDLDGNTVKVGCHIGKDPIGFEPK
jgi:hypothetical protein